MNNPRGLNEPPHCPFGRAVPGPTSRPQGSRTHGPVHALAYDTLWTQSMSVRNTLATVREWTHAGRAAHAGSPRQNRLKPRPLGAERTPVIINWGQRKREVVHARGGVRLAHGKSAHNNNNNMACTLKGATPPTHTHTHTHTPHTLTSPERII